MKKIDHKIVHKTYKNTLGVLHCHIAMGIFVHSNELNTLASADTSTDTPYPEAERLVTTVSVISETTNSNSLLPNTASNDIQQHVNSANSGSF
jgi:hypothetical protein